MISDVISTVLRAVIGNYMISCFVLGLVVAAVQVARWKGHRSASVVSGLFLNAFVFYALGIAMVINFVMHSVFGDYAAETIGWAQSPFQLELALASLGVGLIAIVTHGRRTGFRTKVVVVVAAVVFGLGAAAGHVYQTIVNHDYAVNNTGLLLIGDIAINVIGLILVIWHAVARRGEETHPTDALVLPAISPRDAADDAHREARADEGREAREPRIDA
ncbi:DUF6790 family protein [Cnuibacter sp. UC19_7]